MTPAARTQGHEAKANSAGRQQRSRATRAGSLDVVFQGLVGDFDHFLEVVVRLLLARAYWSRKSSFVCAFVMDWR
jgi:hypothetical protein